VTERIKHRTIGLLVSLVPESFHSPGLHKIDIFEEAAPYICVLYVAPEDVTWSHSSNAVALLVNF